MVRKIKKYEKLISAWLKTFAEERTDAEMEYQLISDIQNHHYQVIRTGWYDDGFVYNVLFHFQIKPNGKIWILLSGTDLEIRFGNTEFGILILKQIGFKKPLC
jgi:XisI protein